MTRAILQTPVDPSLRKAAEKKAEKDGFSSVQQVVRKFLNDYAKGKLEISFEERFPPVELSQKAVKRYDKMTEDFKKGRNIFVAENVEDLMDQLNGVKDPIPFKVSKTLQRKGVSKQITRRSLQRRNRFFYK